jgi:hypothetical protein
LYNTSVWFALTNLRGIHAVSARTGFVDMPEDKPNVKRIFEGISNKLLVDFDLVQAQIKHAGERGKQRENALASLLIKYLPKKYAVGSGHVMDVTGNISHQCDLVIYDAFNCPLLLVEDDYQLFPVESVLGVVEVKSVLNSRALVESVANIQSVRRLERQEPVAGFVFGYRSGFTKEPRIVAVARALQKANGNVPARERLDLLCVLSDGLIQEWKGEPKWDESDCRLQVCLEAEPTTLLLFMSWLIDGLEERSSSMPSLVGYASGFGIGTSTLLRPRI